MARLFAGLDLGQQNDYTALSVIESTIAMPYYRLRHLERLPLRTSYPDQVSHVCEVCTQIGKHTGALPLLGVDFGGCGAPVYDLLKDAYPGTTKGCLITGGSTVTINDDGKIHRIPKLSLISRLRVTMETGNLKIPRTLAEGETFVEEMGNFELKMDEKGHVSMNAAGSGHDDLVLSVAIAVYFANERGGHYGTQQFITPMAGSPNYRPPDLHLAIPVQFTVKKRAFPQLGRL